jgi:ubiquinone/menaquinone biosynthesis C-methylase UbiE
VQWLLQIFFIHNASEHTFNGNLPYNHIMDVAGGKGELAARLSCAMEGMKLAMVDLSLRG